MRLTVDGHSGLDWLLVDILDETDCWWTFWMRLTLDGHSGLHRLLMDVLDETDCWWTFWIRLTTELVLQKIAWLLREVSHSTYNSCFPSLQIELGRETCVSLGLCERLHSCAFVKQWPHTQTLLLHDCSVAVHEQKDFESYLLKVADRLVTGT